MNGVNVFNLRLAREIRKRGADGRILITGTVRADKKPLPLPVDVPVDRLEVLPGLPRVRRWQAMADYLERRAPCIYLPNHDLEYSCLSPVLSERIGVVGVVHSDDPEHLEHVRRLGFSWDAVVAVSEAVCRRTLASNPHLSGKVIKISHGVPAAKPRTPKRPEAGRPLRIVYAGILKHYQKRVLDLARIVDRLEAEKMCFEMTIAGSGEDRDQLIRRLLGPVRRGAVRFAGIVPPDDMAEIFTGQDVFLLLSEFEGFPNALIEAMSAGCVPLVTDIPSGIPELVEDGVNGYRIPVGDVRRFAGCLAALARDRTLLNQLSEAAYAAVSEGGYTASAMGENYWNLFSKIMDARAGASGKRKGKILPPPRVPVYGLNRLLTPWRDLKRRCVRGWRRMDAFWESLLGEEARP